MNTPKGHSAEKQENVTAEAAGGGNCPGPANSALPSLPRGPDPARSRCSGQAWPLGH